MKCVKYIVTLTVQGIDIAMTVINDNDYISLTDMIKAKDGDFFHKQLAS